jgi:hypothetical protein
MVIGRAGALRGAARRVQVGRLRAQRRYDVYRVSHLVYAKAAAVEDFR